MENNNVCSICFDNIDSNDVYDNIENDNNNREFTLECNHKFHTKCIMSWFRTGKPNCPLCNDDTFHKTDFWTKIECIKEIKNMGRRKDCPVKLKKILNSIKVLKDKQSLCKKERILFEKDNKHIIKQYIDYRRQRWDFPRNIRKLENKLLAFAVLNPIYINKT